MTEKNVFTMELIEHMTKMIVDNLVDHMDDLNKAYVESGKNLKISLATTVRAPSKSKGESGDAVVDSTIKFKISPEVQNKLTEVYDQQQMKIPFEKRSEA